MSGPAVSQHAECQPGQLSKEQLEAQPGRGFNSSGQKECIECGTTSTPLWRNGPLGKKMYCNRCAIRIARQAAKQGKKTGSGAGHSGGAGASKQAKAGTARKASQGHNAEGDEPAAKRKRQASQRKPEKEHQVDEMESKPAAEAAKGAENSPDTNDTKEKTGQLISSVSASEGTGPADVAFEALCSGTTDSLSGGGLIEEDGGLLDIPSVEGVGGSDAVLQEPIPTAGGMRTSHSFVWTFGDDQPVHS